VGDVDGAIAALQQAVELDPDRADAHYELGVLYYTEKDDLERAVDEIEAAIGLDPNDATARMIYQELLLERGQS
jgi:tetratricopeptide (TPR) repeat protein